MTRGSEEEFEGGEGDDGGEGSGSDGEAVDPNQKTVVDVSLDFCDPHERFFHGIKCVCLFSLLLF